MLKPRLIEVIRLGSMGDLVLCEPSIRALANAHPEAQVRLVARRRWHDLYRHHPQVDEVLDLSSARAAAPPDLSVDLHNRLDTRRLAARAPQRTHWRKRRGFDLLRGLLGQPLHRSYRGGPHQLERLARALDLPPSRPELHLSQAWREQVAGLEVGVLLVPGAGWAVKAWPAERFAALARALSGRGHPVSVVGGPGEESVVTTVATSGRAQAMPADLGVGPLGALLERAAVVVANDSGPAHLAAALGTPVVTIFGPTAPGRWGPPSEGGLVVTSDPPCGPCSDFGGRGCREARRHCLEDLDVERVLEAVARLIRPPADREADPLGPKGGASGPQL